MASCHFCKVVPQQQQQFKSCVCRKVSYCSRECQTQDWKSHKPSCPLYVIRESPGKGRGLFATRRIKEGQIILEEYPIFTHDGAMSLQDFKFNHYPNMDEDTRSKILQLFDPAENFKKLDRNTANELVRKDPSLQHYKEAKSDKMNKIFRIIDGSRLTICDAPALYSESEVGLYNHISRINYACVANTSLTWVMGDFEKKQVRAIMNIEKGEEITFCFLTQPEFFYGSRESRQQQMLEHGAFFCQCSECSLEGEALEENDKMRAEILESEHAIIELMVRGMMAVRDSRPFDERRDVKKGMKLSQRRTKLVTKLNLRAGFMYVMVQSYHLSGSQEVGHLL